MLKQPLKGPHCTLFEVLNATDYVTPALEILETRDCIASIRKPRRRARSWIRSPTMRRMRRWSSGGRPIRPHDADLRWIGALLFRNGQIEETGIAAGVLNHPANGIAWLANRLAAQGEDLAAGEVVLAGSFTRPVDIARGDTFHADYGPFGSVSCQFV